MYFRCLISENFCPFLSLAVTPPVLLGSPAGNDLIFLRNKILPPDHGTKNVTEITLKTAVPLNGTEVLK